MGSSNEKSEFGFGFQAPDNLKQSFIKRAESLKMKQLVSD
jgi:hypothetical protein